MEEIKHGNKKSFHYLFFFIFLEGDGESGQNRLAFLIEQIQEKNHIENAPNPSPSFVEPCIVSDPNLPGASPPQRQVKLVSRMMGNYLLRFGEDSAVSQYPLGFGVDPFTLFYYIRLVKRMFFDTPRTWILYEPMDRDKSLLLAITSSFITSFFPYPSPLFSVTHQMALSSYL